MSDGTLRVLGILVALYQELGPGVIALEEPELTVHPGILQMLAEMIKEVSQRRQILLTTHSPELLDYFDPEDIVAVDYEDGATTARPLNKAQSKAVRERLFSLGELMTVEGLRG
jgi:predicted ATPase